MASQSKHKQRRSVAYSQNFLRSPALAERLVAASSISADDTVVEIGPGQGVLTRQLAARCRQVIAVEKDERLAGELSRSLGDTRNVVVYAADFLTLPLPATPYKVFANIPFNVTAEIVTKLTRGIPNRAGERLPQDAYLVMQREAAERFAGRPRETLFSALLKPWFEPEVVHQFRAEDFVPLPRVSIVLMRFNKRGPPLVAAGEAQRYRDFVVHGFTAWKPTIRAAFEPLFGRRCLEAARRELGPSLNRKPSQVSFDQWLALYRCLRDGAPAGAWAEIDGAEQRLRERQSGLSKSHRTRVALTR